MKKIFFILLVGFVMHAQSYGDDRVVLPQLEIVQPTNVFVPMGFDDNDNAQVVVSGILPTTCYKNGPTEVQVDRQKGQIHITQKNYVTYGCWCADIATPYANTVDLGLLEAGRYKIIVHTNSGTRTERESLPIAVAPAETTDNFHYAQVEDAYVDFKGGRQSAELVLRGTYTSDCIRIVAVKIIYRKSNVIEVLPITNLKEGDVCRPDVRPFETRKKLSVKTKGPTLIHVRSMGGKSINKVYNF